MAPLLEFIGRSYGVRHTTFDCGTIEELALRLKKSRRAGYGILYFAGHGQSGKFITDNGEVTLCQISEMMNHRFEGWFVHFGSCSILNVNLKEVKQFKHDTGVRRVSGYRKPVEWSESSAFDVVWLSHLVNEDRLDWELHSKMRKHLGFAYA